MPKTIPLNVPITPAAYAELSREARRRGSSRSALVREALADAVPSLADELRSVGTWTPRG